MTREARLAALRQEHKTLCARIGRDRATGQDVSSLITQSSALSLEIKNLCSIAIGEERDAPPITSQKPTVEVLTQEDEFSALREEWSRLIAEASCCSPFMRWEWLFPWWRHYGHDKELRLITVRDEAGELIAVAPMMIGFRESGRFSARTLAFVGSGHEGPNGQCFEVLARPDQQEASVGQIWKALEGIQKEWDVLRMWKVGDSPMTWRLLAGIAGSHDHAMFIEPAPGALWAPLPGTYQEFLARMSSKSERHILRNQYRRVQDVFPSMEFGICTNTAELDDLVRTIMDLSIDRLGVLGKSSAWREPVARESLLEATQLMCNAGYGQVASISIDGRVVAGVVALLSADTLFIYAPSFDVEFSKHKVMHALYGKVIESAISDGLSRLDCLSSHYHFSKYASEERRMFHINVCGRTSAGYERSARRVWFRSLKRRLGGSLLGPEK